MENNIRSLGDAFAKQTGVCSTVSRQIVFALFALVWTLSYKDGEFDISDKTYYSTGILLFYLIVDIFQYLITAIRLRNHYFDFESSANNPLNSLEEIELADREAMKKIHNCSYWMLILKLSLLPFVFCFIFTLIQERL